MNLQQYKTLCKYCDEILASDISTSTTKSLPWLHVLGLNPNTQKKYDNIWNPKRSSALKSLSRLFIYFCYNMIFGTSLQFIIGKDKSQEKTDLLIISHFINEQHANNDIDFYFGDLMHKLAEMNISSKILLLNHTRIPNKSIAGSWGESKIQRIFLANRLSFFSEFKLLSQLCGQSLLLRRLAKKQQDEIAIRIYRQAAREALSPESVAALRYQKQMKELFSQLKPQAVITTFEGHSYERITYSVAKLLDKNTMCFGYQHAPLFPHQHAIKRSLGSDYDPDKVFTTGHQTIVPLLEEFSSKGVDILSLGSYKSHVVPLPSDQLELHDRSICLILLDGNIDECLKLLDFTLQAASELEKIDFEIRLHPIVTLEKISNHNKNVKNLPSNLRISVNQDMKVDFAKSRWVIHRVSGAAIYAGKAFCRPIYASLGDEISLDPLYLIKGEHKAIDNIAELKAIILEDLALSEAEFVEKMTEVASYCNDYFIPMDIEPLTKALSTKLGVHRYVDI